MPNHDSPHFDFSDDPQVTGTKTSGTGAVLGIILLSLGSAFFLADTVIPHRNEPATKAKTDKKTGTAAPATSLPTAKP
jgi:hypothetical protein